VSLGSEEVKPVYGEVENVVCASALNFYDVAKVLLAVP